NYVPNVNNFGVDLQTGAATASFPINVPAGPAGFAPQIALTYNSRNVDDIDASQQGASPIGWGWSLSGSYVAARQHFFDNYSPWTASIVADGVNGDLTLGTDNYWHTSDESFARV